MDWSSIVQLITTFLFGGGILTFVTLKDKKTEAILSNMQKVIDEQREMMKHKKDMYEAILNQKDEEIADLRKSVERAEEKAEKKEDKIEEQFRINSSLRHKLDEANTARAVAEVLLCDKSSCTDRNPPFGSHLHLNCNTCKKGGEGICEEETQLDEKLR